MKKAIGLKEGRKRYTEKLEGRKGMEKGCNYNINKKEHHMYVCRKN